MKLVIDIPNHVKNRLIFGVTYKDDLRIMVETITNGTPLDSIIADIEAARDKDKLCEYPYNRCINIIKKAVGDES